MSFSINFEGDDGAELVAFALRKVASYEGATRVEIEDEAGVLTEHEVKVLDVPEGSQTANVQTWDDGVGDGVGQPWALDIFRVRDLTIY